jgi:hypothetical protein
MITHYDAPLARRYIFIHGHETAWHYDWPVSTQIPCIMETSFWHTNQYGGVFPVYSGAWSPRTKGWGHNLYSYVFRGTSMPPKPLQYGWWPCCATFWVDSALIRTRTKAEYILVRKRLIQWSVDHNRMVSPAWFCGRIMEYHWALWLTNRTHIPIIPRKCNPP